MARWRAHLARAGRAVLNAGPGRLPGAILEARVSPGDVVVEGWAALPSNDIQSVWVTVDGVVQAHAELGRPTPADDAGAPLTDCSETAGWRATLERDGIAAGTRSLGALVLRAYGLVEVLEPLQVDLPDLGDPGDIEEPLEGAVIAGNLVVRGWFLSGRGYDTVEVVIAGAEPVRARLLCSPRPALAASVADPDAPLAGWELLVPFDATRAGESTVIVDIDGPRGRRRLGERTVQWLPAAGTGVAEPERAAVIEARTALLTAAHRPDGEGLNLLVAAHHLGLGGGQLYLQELLRHLLREPDVTCTVLASVDGALRDELEALGASVHIVGDPTPTAVPYEHWLHQVAALATTTTANAVLANTVGSYWGVDLAARLGVPSVWAVHESWSPELIFALTFSSLPDDAVRKRFLQAFRQAGAVVFEAEATKRIFEPFMPDGRGVRIDYGIDLERIRAFAADTPREQLRARLGVQPGQVLLLCLGTYEPRKAQGVLATAFARIAEEHPWAVLALVGDKPGEFSVALHELVRNFALEDRARLIPVTPDIDDWYLAADAFVIASDVESLPRSMLEAMAFGTPVLATAVFGVPEIVEDGINGLLFDPSSVTSAAAALQRVLRMARSERQDIGERGRATVEANRSSALYARDYRALFAALAAADQPDLAAALEAR